MELAHYFSVTQGIGILSSAAASGEVTSAVYSKPQVLDATTVAFLMRERLSYAHLQQNPHACYLFVEHSEGFQGLRLYLEKIDEIDDPDLVSALTRPHLSPHEDRARGPKHLTRFRVIKVLPLVGDGPVAS